MSKHLLLEIREAESFLKQAYIQEKHPRKKERLHALYLYKAGIATERRILSKLLSRSGVTLTTWFNSYREKGLKGLLSIGSGGHRPRLISDLVLSGINKRLSSELGFSGYKEVQVWLKAEYDLDIPYSTVRTTVKKYLNANLKTTRSRSDKQSLQTSK